MRLIDRALDRLLPGGGRGAAGRIREAMRYCVLSGGKRFRPLLCLGGCDAVGAPARRALPAACAIELMHTYSLVHDDLPAMDDAATRRGRPSCHRKFGEGNAILVGDALLTFAFEFLGRQGTPHALRIINTLGRACGTVGLIGGQALDLEALRSQTASAAALREIARRKTAALIAASVTAGALAGLPPEALAKGGGADTASLKRLRRYGQDIGLAFQLVDDAHDHDGLARSLGADAAKREAHRLIGRALETLAPFGRRADTLRELAVMLASTVC
ncbi:MAG: polyprenyl synthetase family protein [bacterium]